MAVDLDTERAALADAREAVADKLVTLRGLATGTGADALADDYIDAVVSGAIDKLQRELVVFGRIDDDHVWRVGLYGIDRGGEQLVVDWRAPFAGAFYQAGFDDPRGLERRVSYVGCIDDLFVEDFASGAVAGSSPLLAELSRSRGSEMRAAVATLQADQDRLVRLPPDATLVLRGGPGTGKTVVGLHRAAWLVYNDDRITADRILVVGPSDRFLRFVAAVLPTLGEARIYQTTFDRLLGPSVAAVAGHDEQWLDRLDRFEATMLRPGPIPIGQVRSIPEHKVEAMMTRVLARNLPWRERRKVFVANLAAEYRLKVGDLSRVAADVWPAFTAKQAMARLTAEPELRSARTDGALTDEVRARFEGVPARYAHVIVDEAQDLSLLRLRAVQRRATGLTLVGDDAQRSEPGSLGLRGIAADLGVPMEEMATAYRMSAEIASWLNDHAAAHGIDAVPLVGIRPTGTAVGTGRPSAADSELRRLADRWTNVVQIGAGEVWAHKGVEYDGVVVDATGMSPGELYLAASRAAHELVVLGTG